MLKRNTKQVKEGGRSYHISDFITLIMSFVLVTKSLLRLLDAEKCVIIYGRLRKLRKDLVFELN